MDVDEVRASTAECFPEGEEPDLSYITEELLAEYVEAEEYGEEEPSFDADDEEQAESARAAEEASKEAEEGSKEAITPFYYKYGNRPIFIRDYTKPGYVGKVLYYNGSYNRPNNPCGTMYRRLTWSHYTPTWSQYQNCGPYWGWQITVW